MASTSSVAVSINGSVARITLDRADRHNAFDDRVIEELTRAFERVQSDSAVRVVVLAAAGPSFSAGADLAWMRRMAAASLEENEADALALARMLERLHGLPQPSVALVQGPAFGGGVGLIAACDIAIAAETAQFAFPEVKLGLIPATIAPYVVAAIGAREAHRYMLTAERFDAAEALRIGLVHSVTANVEQEGERVIEALLANGPEAVKSAKRLIRLVDGRAIDDVLRNKTARLLAEIRTGAEARDRIQAFLARKGR